MPRYDFACPGCGCVSETVLSLARYDDEQRCKNCGSVMKRLISAGTMVIPDWEPFMHDNLGHEPVLVKNRQHHKQLLAERGLEGKWGEGHRSKWV